MSPISMEEIRRIVGSHLAQLSPLFVKDIKLTFIARLPGNQEAELVVTDDPELGEVVKAIERARLRGKQ
jgi:hypothetical protein